MGLGPVFIEGQEDAVDVGEGQGRGIGIATIDQDLDRRGSPGKKVGREVGSNPQDQEGLLAVEERRNLRLTLDPAHQGEGGSAGKARQQFAGRNAPILIVDRIGNVIEVEAGGIAKDQQLRYGGHDEDEATALVPQQDQQLLDDQPPDTHPHPSRASCGSDAGSGRGRPAP